MTRPRTTASTVRRIEPEATLVDVLLCAVLAPAACSSDGLTQAGPDGGISATDGQAVQGDSEASGRAPLSDASRVDAAADGATGAAADGGTGAGADGGTGAGSDGGTLLWSDEFDTLDLASTSNPKGLWRVGDTWQGIDNGWKDFAGTNWNVNPAKAPYDGYNPFSVNGGVLTIKAFRTPAALKSAIAADMASQGIGGSVPEWCSGHVVLNPAAHRYQFGYTEFRARWPNPGKGMFPALWFYSYQAVNPQSHSGDEIDLLEIFGHPTGQPWSTGVPTTPTGSRSLGEQATDTTSWHTYGMDWQKTYIHFYHDGVKLYELTGDDAAYFSGSYLNIRFNLAMDAPWMSGNNLGSDSSTPDPLLMELDYVRVYASKP